MDRMHGSPGGTDDDFGGFGGFGEHDAAKRGSSKLAWILAGWIVLSILAVVGALVLNRGSNNDDTTQGTKLGNGVAANGAQGDARLPVSVTSTTAPEPAEGSQNWTVHIIYTAVEKFYRGARVAVSGCPAPVCTQSRTAFGTFPRTFVHAVQSSGSGVITSGRYSGKFLDYDPTVGFWLDSAARGYGSPAMTSFASARSTSALLPLGSRLRITVCGPSTRKDAISVCSKLRSATWNVVAEGPTSPARDIYLYAGRETGPGAAGRPWSSNFRHATLRVG